MDILNSHNENIARKTGYNGQCMTKKSRFGTSRVMQSDATLIYRLPPNATIGPILSIRAFEFESLYVLDPLIPDMRDVKQAVWITAW